MRKGAVVSCLNPSLLIAFLVLLSPNGMNCSLLDYFRGPVILGRKEDAVLLEASPAPALQPLLPPAAPSPLAPFTNKTVPKLSGMCLLNFASVESLMSVTANDCAAVFAPFLANVVCCPQLEATAIILIGQSSKYSNMLALNGTSSKHCFSDFEKLLVGRGAHINLQQICSIHPSNLTEGSCPVKDVNEFESLVDSSKLLSLCGKIDLVNECCDQLCQNAISEAATTLALKAYDLLSMDGPHTLSDHSTRIADCKSIVLRWLARKLSPSHSKEILRGLSNCNINKVCPLSFPPLSNIVKSCAHGMSNQSECCKAMESYMSHNLQRQSFITNLQALNCAASLGMKLQKASITKNIYNICHISLKDFSVQAIGTQASGCLLPSLPTDIIFDKITGVGFLCDLNDNIPAPWPSSLHLASSSCNKTVKIPALPAAASGQRSLYTRDVMFLLFSTASMILIIIL